MEKRQEKLSELRKYVEGVDKEITMILQSLQWDRKHLLEGDALVPCSYDANHRVPPDKKSGHEEECFLRSQRYAEDDRMLPEPLDENAPTIVRFNKEEISDIIDKAALNDPSFRRVFDFSGCNNMKTKYPFFSQYPSLTAERLQATYTSDERRAIYDAVVSAAPDEYCVEDLAPPGSGGEVKPRAKSKLEVLAELRDMRRRRAKYRGAGANSNNYSNVLRDVIKTQMELFTGVKDEPDSELKPVNNARGQFNYKHNYNTADNRNERHEKYRGEYKTERYEESSRSRDKRSYDSRKEINYREEKGKHRHRETYDDKYGKIDRSTEKYYKKDTNTKDYYEEENGQSSSKYKDKSRHKDDRKYSDKYSSSTENYREASECKSEKSYKSEKHTELSSRSTKRHRDDYDEKYEDSRSKKKHRDYDDSKHRSHRDSKREDSKYKQHKRYS